VAARGVAHTARVKSHRHAQLGPHAHANPNTTKLTAGIDVTTRREDGRLSLRSSWPRGRRRERQFESQPHSPRSAFRCTLSFTAAVTGAAVDVC